MGFGCLNTFSQGPIWSTRAKHWLFFLKHPSMLRRNIPRTNLRNFENKIGPQKTGAFCSEIWQNLPSSKHNTEWGRIFPFTTGRGPPCTFFPLNHDGRKSKIHDGRYEFLWKSLKSRQITSIQHLSFDFCPSAVAKKNNVNKQITFFLMVTRILSIDCHFLCCQVPKQVLRLFLRYPKITHNMKIPPPTTKNL